MTRLRHAVIGVGGIGATHVRCALAEPGVELAAVADIDQRCAERIAQQYETRVARDYRELIDGDLADSVSIAVPHDQLAPLASAFLKAGKHVLVEKPFAVSGDEARALIGAARDHRVKLCVCFQQRFYRLSMLMKKHLPEIGRIHRVVWTSSIFRPDAHRGQNSWARSWEKSGSGVLMHQFSHQLDLLFWLLGPPRSIQASIANQTHAGPLEDRAAGIIELESGAECVVNASMNEPTVGCTRQIFGDLGMIWAPDVQSVVGDRSDSIRLGTFDESLSAGTRSRTDASQPGVTWRTLHTGRSLRFRRRILRPRRLWKKTRFLSEPPFEVAHRKLFSGFVQAIREDTEPPVPPEEALWTVESINAFIVSAVTGRRVELPVDPLEFGRIRENLVSGEATIPKLER